MTAIEVSESSDGEVYTFTIKQRTVNSVVNLTSYTGVTMDLISSDLATNYGTITMSFGTKSAGEVKYTTDTLDPYPSIPTGSKYVKLLGQVKITGTGLVTITDEFEITLVKDYSTI